MQQVTEIGAVVPAHWHIQVANELQISDTSGGGIDATYRDASITDSGSCRSLWTLI